MINSPNTIEHILPQETYPEYAIDVKNLIPSCGECNSAKGEDVVDKNGNKIIINYYTDIIPDEQFLFVDISYNGGALTFRYRLANVNNKIDFALFALIERHFKRLHLLDRYDEKAIQEMAEIKNTYLAEQFENDEQFNVSPKNRFINAIWIHGIMVETIGRWC